MLMTKKDFDEYCRIASVTNIGQAMENAVIAAEDNMANYILERMSKVININDESYKLLKTLCETLSVNIDFNKQELIYTFDNCTGNKDLDVNHNTPCKYCKYKDAPSDSCYKSLKGDIINKLRGDK